MVFKYDEKTGAALQGAEFQIRYLGGTSGTGGTVIGTYTTSENGSIILTRLKAGTYIVEETKASPFYSIDTPPQTVLLSGKDQDVVTLRFSNQPYGSVLIKKLADDANKTPLAGATFLVTDDKGTFIGSANGEFTTDKSGAIQLPKLPAGTTIVAKEIRPPEGYALDGTPQAITVQAGENAPLTFYDKPLCNLTILKRDALTKKPLAKAEFIVKDSEGKPIGTDNGRFVTGSDGTVTITALNPNATIIVSEDKAPIGYIKDETPKTIVVRSGVPNSLTFDNEPSTTLVIHKYIEGTENEPLSGVAFKVVDGSGAAVGPDDGVYYTDKAGEIVLNGLEPGTTVVAREIKSVDGFVLDGTPQDILIKAGTVQNLTFWNKRQGALIINKLDAVTKKPLAGVTFKITTAAGEFVPDENGKISSNGLYYTNESGQIILKGVTGTLVVTEEKSIDGYTIDENTRTQTVVVNPDDTQSLYFYNAPIGGVELIKVNAADETQRIPNTTFEIRRVSDGGLVDTVTTGTDGRVYVPLASGSYYAVETKAGKGFQLDSTPIYFIVEDGKTTTKAVTNKAISGILIHKVNAVTGEGIPGVSFLLYDSGNNPIAQETSDDRGYVRFEGLEDGRYYLRELENEGYIPDTQKKTVYIKSGETTEVEWQNTPITGQIQVTKVSADYNAMNGWPAGTPIPNTVFEIYNARTNRLVDTIKTDKNGLAVSKPLPLARYKIVESKAAEFYGLDKTPIEVEIEYAGQIVKASMTNKSLSTNVSIKKTGYVEVMPGQLVRYNFAGIANNSTTALGSFYWRDTLPVKAVRLQTIYTGTWNTPGNYKIVYRTNLSRDTWRTLADNLSTSKNYVLDASPAALGLAANEYVTEFMAAFGIVPANFRQVEAPRVDCKALAKLTGGTQFVNQADAGGVYNGQWIMATSRWVTRIYAPSKPLPRTGY